MRKIWLMPVLDPRPQDCPACRLVTVLPEPSAAGCNVNWNCSNAPIYDMDPGTTSYKRLDNHTTYRPTAPGTAALSRWHSQFLFRTLCDPVNIQPHTLVTGARGSAVGWRTSLSAGRSRVRFSLTSSCPPHCGPAVDSASNRNKYQEYFLGG